MKARLGNGTALQQAGTPMQGLDGPACWTVLEEGYSEAFRLPSRWMILFFALFLASNVWGAPPRTGEGPVAIGLVSYLWGPTADMIAMRDGLVELGYRENHDFALGARMAESDASALEPIIQQLLHDGARIIYAGGLEVLKVALKAAPNTPIVFALWSESPEAGRLSGLKSSGANATGVINTIENIGGEALREFLGIVPQIKRVMVPYAATDASFIRSLPNLRRAAADIGVSLIERPLHTRLEAQKAIASIGKSEVGGILAASGALNISGYALEASLLRKIPAVFPRAWMAEAGGLASYGPSWDGLGREAAGLMGKIIGGANPRDIPLVLNRRRELVINLRAAKALGIAVPAKTLARAHKVIGG